MSFLGLKPTIYIFRGHVNFSGILRRSVWGCVPILSYDWSVFQVVLGLVNDVARTLARSTKCLKIAPRMGNIEIFLICSPNCTFTLIVLLKI